MHTNTTSPRTLEFHKHTSEMIAQYSIPTDFEEEIVVENMQSLEENSCNTSGTTDSCISEGLRKKMLFLGFTHRYLDFWLSSRFHEPRHEQVHTDLFFRLTGRE